LDQLVELRDMAYAGTVTLPTWRRRWRALVKEGPALPAADELIAAEEVCHEAWLDAALKGEDGTAQAQAVKRARGRLRALAGPPSDEGLWTHLGELVDDRPSPENLEAYLDRLELVRGWLSGPGSGYDGGSGLPWASLAEFRWIRTEVGMVPATVAMARAQARKVLRQLPPSAPVAVRARLLSSEGDGRVGDMVPELEQANLVGFAKLMASYRDTGSPAQRKLVDAFTVMWGSAELDELLLEHTAPGWPRRYARLPRPASPS
jgi:hypothetical protein